VTLASSPRALPVLPTDGGRRGPDRSADRRIAFAGMLAAAGFLGLAAVSLALPDAVRLGVWLPLHLAMAGGTGTAIAAMLPFFTTALAVAPPAPAALRIGGVGLVALGALAIALGRAAGLDAVAVAGGVGYLGGVSIVAVAAFRPLAVASGPRRTIVEWAYALALLDLALGATFATAFLAGNPSIVASWGWLKPAHAWLNLFGFVTLVIVGTLVHLAPTVAGARIRSRRSGNVAVVGLGLGAPSVALGYALRIPGLADLGAMLAVIGAAALLLHVISARRDRAGWTSEHAWHRFATGSLVVAPAWLLVATVIAGTRLISGGVDPSSWRLADVVAPLVLGFVLQVLMGAWTHLVPAVGPGLPEVHALRRGMLGRAATHRLVAWNAGVALLSAGLLAQGARGSPLALLPALLGLGIALAGSTFAANLGLLAAAVRPGRGRPTD
jgi:hypothetical protein